MMSGLPRWLLGTVLALSSFEAAAASPLSLRMRGGSAPVEPVEPSEPDPTGDATPDASDEEPARPAGSGAEAAVTPSIPPPSSIRDVPEHLTVAIGLGPQAPGTRAEQAVLDALETGLAASTDPTTEIRRLRPGMGARRVCRDQRNDLVVMIDYIAEREAPVVLAHDCALDRALGLRAADAASNPGLAAALWAEHTELLREGVRERRRISLGPRARGGIIAGAAIVVVGVAVAVLVASALRKETVVITVRP